MQIGFSHSVFYVSMLEKVLVKETRSVLFVLVFISLGFYLFVCGKDAF